VKKSFLEKFLTNIAIIAVFLFFILVWHTFKTQGLPGFASNFAILIFLALIAVLCFFMIKTGPIWQRRKNMPIRMFPRIDDGPWQLLPERNDNAPLQLRIQAIDTGPEDLQPQLPVMITLVRRLTGPDNPNYWLAKPERPIFFGKEKINYFIVGAMWKDVRLQQGVGKDVGIFVAYVTDESLLEDRTMDFTKARDVARCIADEVY